MEYLNNLGVLVLVVFLGSWANSLGNLNFPSFQMTLCYCAFRSPLVLGRVKLHKQMILWPNFSPHLPKQGVCHVYSTPDWELGHLVSIPQSSTAISLYNWIISGMCSPFRVTHYPGFPRTVLILALKVLKPGKSLSPRYTWTIGYHTSFIFPELDPSSRFQHFCFVESPEEYKCIF